MTNDNNGVDVLAVMDRAIERNRERGAAIGSPSDRSLREARDAVRELIEELRLSAKALEAAAKCVGPDLAIVLGDRAMFARAALARVGGAA